MPKRIVTDVLWLKSNRVVPVAFIKTAKLTFQGVCPWCGKDIDIPFEAPVGSTIGDLAEHLYNITGDHMPNCTCGDKTDPFNDLNVITHHLN